MNLRRKARCAVGSRHSRKNQRHAKGPHPAILVERKYRELLARATPVTA